MVDAVQSNFTFSPLFGRPGVTITFTDLSGNLGANAPCKFEWDWGDGSTWGNTQNATHIYNRAGNFTVVHWVTGSINLTRSMKTLTIPIGEDITPKPLCDPTKGNPAGIVAYSAPYADKWSGAYPNSICIQPYLCMCAPTYTKYRCEPNGSATKIWEQHADCCAFCGAPPIPPGTPEPVVYMPVFEIISVDVTPVNPGRTELITAIAHVKNTGNAAGSATVIFYWENGIALDLPRTTEQISVNTTLMTPPAKGFAPGEGAHTLCAELR